MARTTTETPLRRSRPVKWSDLNEGDFIEVVREYLKTGEVVIRKGFVRRAVPHGAKNKVLCLGENSLGELRKNGYDILQVTPKGDA